MYQHPSRCEHFTHIIDTLRLQEIHASTTEIDNKHHFVNAVISYFCFLDTCCNWSQLLHLEPMYIKAFESQINDGLKSNRRAYFISIERR